MCWDHANSLTWALINDEPSVIIHSGKKTPSGEDVYGVFRVPADDGRYTEVLWVTGDSLKVFVKDLPRAPQWTNGGRLLFDTSLGVSSAENHLLAHAGRWLESKNLLTGEVDERGQDRFVDAAARDTAMTIIRGELEKSLVWARLHPESIPAGFYPSLTAKKGSGVSPICFYLPAFFQSNGMPKVVFALRRIEEGGVARYVAVTVLMPNYAARCIRQIAKCPTWLTGDVA